MSVILPSTPSPAEFEIIQVGNFVDQVPPLGGVTSRISRLGDRFQANVVYPPMKYADAMAWFAALATAMSDTVLLPIIQPEFTVGTVGTPLVNGGSQSGATINLDGFAANYAAKAGQFFSHIGSTQRYLYMLTADKTATAGGVAASTAIWPNIQSSPADNAALEFTTPILEGWIQGNRNSWTVNRIMAEGLAFDVLGA